MPKKADGTLTVAINRGAAYIEAADRVRTASEKLPRSFDASAIDALIPPEGKYRGQAAP